MPNSEVGGLTVATTPLGGTELLHIVQSGNSRQATVQNLLNATTLAAGGALLASNNLSEVTAATARTNLGLAIGTDVQAYDAGLADIAGLAVTDGNIIVGNGTNWVAESGAIARASLGLGTAATQNTGTSGTNVPLLDGANTWSASQTFSAAALFAAGSESAPSISFSGDTDTGFWRSAADTLKMGTNSTERDSCNASGVRILTAEHGTTGSRVEIRKTNSVTSFSTSNAAFVVQTLRDDDETTNGTKNSGSIFTFTKNASGPTSGLSSQAVWPNIRIVTSNTGDSSVPGLNMQGNIYAPTTWDSGTLQAGSTTSATLEAGFDTNDDYYNGKILVVTGGTGSGQNALITDYVGSTGVATIEDLETGAALSTALDATSTYNIVGYNELGGTSGTLINSGSDFAYMVGHEWLLQDGGYDTRMKGFVSRIDRDANGIRSVGHFEASIEGTYRPDYILGINENSSTGVKTHLEMRTVDASSGNVLTMPNDHYVAIENSTGSLIQMIGMNSSNQTIIKPGGTGAAVLLQDGAGASRVKADNGGVEIRPSGESTLQEITVGATDSGGSGFRLLRIPN